MGGVLPIDHAWAPYLSGPMALVMFVPSVVCGYLAYWQYERKKWKVRIDFWSMRQGDRLGF